MMVTIAYISADASISMILTVSNDLQCDRRQHEKNRRHHHHRHRH